MRGVLAAVCCVCVVTSALSDADAQTATRTWVSGLGSDANPCTRVAPCLTFAGALAKTAAGGEISARDPGSFGPLTINKSIIIDGGATTAEIHGPSHGIIINAGNADIVILRNLSIFAAGASDGVYFQNGRQLIIESSRISGFASNGVRVLAMAGAGNVLIMNSTISMNGHGIHTEAGNTFVGHSTISGNSAVGLVAQNTGVITADSNVLTYNGVGVRAGLGLTVQTAAMVRLSNNDVYNNKVGFGCGGGTIASTGNNRKGSNSGGTAPVCSPTVAITQQ